MNGKKIAELRKNKNMSQEELAEKSKVSRSTISFLETEKEMDVKLETLKKLATALDCNIVDFL